MEIWVQILITIISAIIPASISYFVARYQGKTDLRKANEANRNEIEKLMKQHEINLESLKEQHKMSIEAKEKEQLYKMQLLQKEYELKTKTAQQNSFTEVLSNALGGYVTEILSNPTEATSKIENLKKLSDSIKNGDNK